MNSKKILYKEFCKTETSIPLFSQAWWLDLVCTDDEWDVCLVEKDSKVLASMPYVVKKKYGFKLLTHPYLTQTLGPWIAPSTAKYANQLAQQKDLQEALIEQLPNFHFFRQSWHYSNTNWLPFYWKGFSQTTRYTYILKDLSDVEKSWKELNENIRREIRKAEKRFITIRENLPAEVFLELNKMTFSRQNKKLPYSEKFLLNLMQGAKARNQGKWFIAQDQDGKHHAGVFIVWDQNSAYYLAGGGNPELRNSGATSLAMWEAIKFASTVTKSFDFEGSMLEPVERFFRAFGAKQVAYFQVWKCNPKILASIYALK